MEEVQPNIQSHQTLNCGRKKRGAERLLGGSKKRAGKKQFSHNNAARPEKKHGNKRPKKPEKNKLLPLQTIVWSGGGAAKLILESGTWCEVLRAESQLGWGALMRQQGDAVGTTGCRPERTVYFMKAIVQKSREIRVLVGLRERAGDLVLFYRLQGRKSNSPRENKCHRNWLRSGGGGGQPRKFQQK